MLYNLEIHLAPRSKSLMKESCVSEEPMLLDKARPYLLSAIGGR